MQNHPAIFEAHQIRRVYDDATETWWFSVVDIIQVLTQQPDYQTARKYWDKLKERLGKEGSESVTNCNRLKMPAAARQDANQQEMNEQNANYKSRLRNKLVAEAFYLTGNIEKYGSGFIRIRKALRDYPEISFEAEEMSGGISLTFTQASQPESLVQRVLSILRDGPIAKRDISIKLGQQAVSGQLNKIVQDLLQKGVIEQTHPDKPNSRLQEYRLCDNDAAKNSR
jgi:hypothetical protein